MSIKKLFDTESSRNYSSQKNEKEAFGDVESYRNVEALTEKQKTFKPPVDFKKPERFAKYGSAYLYYKSAIEWIQDYYPYDGSDAEKNEYYNQLLDIERYIFDNLYPRTNGFITFANDQNGGWGGSTNDPDDCDGYGIPGTQEYITFKGGPGTGSLSNSSLTALSVNEYNSKFQNANIYDENIYATEGLPSTYGSGSRESNLKSDFDNGVTVEFWLKTGSAIPLTTLRNETTQQVVFDMWNNNADTEHDYGRVTIELGSGSVASTATITVSATDVANIGEGDTIGLTSTDGTTVTLSLEGQTEASATAAITVSATDVANIGEGDTIELISTDETTVTLSLEGQTEAAAAGTITINVPDVAYIGEGDTIKLISTDAQTVTLTMQGQAGSTTSAETSGDALTAKTLAAGNYANANLHSTAQADEIMRAINYHTKLSATKASPTAATATITVIDSSSPPGVPFIGEGDTIKLIATDETEVTLTMQGTGGSTTSAETSGTTLTAKTLSAGSYANSTLHATAQAVEIKTAINHHTKFSATNSANVVTVTQAINGADGDTTITITELGATGMSKTNFTGGVDDVITVTQATTGYDGNTTITITELGATGLSKANFTGGSNGSTTSSETSGTTLTAKTLSAGSYGSAALHATAQADEIMRAINYHTKFSATKSSNVITVTQATSGADGNTTITITELGATGMSKTNFSGGSNGSTTSAETSGTTLTAKTLSAGSYANATLHATAQADEIMRAINYHTKFSAVKSSNVTTITQADPGPAGNTAITISEIGATGLSKTDFTSGGPESPFMITVQSGNASPGIFQQSIGANIDVDTLAKWHHYAFVMQNTGSGHAVKFFVDGEYDDTLTHTGTIGELPSKDMMGRLGALLTAPSETTATGSLAGAGKLSGSLDEFRFWKTARTAREVGLNWFDQTRGGVNTDISNTALGVYYKFNEGITGVTATDQYVLDYSGRICNGVWTGYGSNSRATGSAIVLASGSAHTYEYKDPIIYSTHPDVSTLKTDLLSSGSYHDAQNNASMLNMVPSWIIEEDEANGNEDTSDLRKMSHIIGTYFDKIYLQIQSFPSLKHKNYTSASHKPIPFAQHLPQSLGLATPSLFVDSTVMEAFLNRNLTGSFDGDLDETKNLIYLNLYNNLTNIYKSKGTEKSIRNVFRCFNIDEELFRLNAYANNSTYELKNNLQQILINKNVLNFNDADNTEAVVYQKSYTGSAFEPAPTNVLSGDTSGYISGSHGAGYSALNAPLGGLGGGGFRGIEDPYGFTAEGSFVFPTFYARRDKFTRNFLTASLFGLYTVATGSAAIKSGAKTSWITSLGIDSGPDVANFQVFSIRDIENSKNVRFMLSSSNEGLGGKVPLPTLTSSNFMGVYNDSKWNLSVRIVPSLTSSRGPAGIVSGSVESFKSGFNNYDLVFSGFNNENGYIQNSFKLTASLNHSVATSFLNAAKRTYAGAYKENITGSTIIKTDVLVNNIKYWTKYLDDGILEQHANDFNNAGLSGSYQSTSPRDLNSFGHDITNNNMLALYWDFENVTGSDSNGNFFITDMSSGSVELRNNYGWAGNYVGYQHTGYGQGFKASSTNTIQRKALNSYRFIDPERVVSSDMIQILSEDDKVFGRPDDVASYYYTIEKSMYNAISEEMIKFFAGVVDFNNIIGAPVNRYRDRYKGLEKLREAFFRKVESVTEVEKFVGYYKWFDDAITTIISQLIPASADFENDLLNTIESHVLERNKYQSKFPTIEFKEPDLDAAMKAARENQYSWKDGSSTVPASPRSTKKNRLYWDERAERSATELSASRSTNSPVVNANIDVQRNIFRRVIYSAPALSQSARLSFTSAGTAYTAGGFSSGSFGKLYNIQFGNPKNKEAVIKGGVNFTDNKNIDFTYNALRPAGPVENSGITFIPQNVILGFANSLVELHETHQWQVDKLAKPLTKRYLKALHGRSFEHDGNGYTNVKSAFAFPFNIISSSVVSGYNKIVVDRVTGGIEIVNLHHDVYGDSFEVPMQGPFTDYAVGGHQSRHVAINTGSDQWYNRPEAWKLLLGTVDGNPFLPDYTGAIGMVAPDYPWPEANEEKWSDPAILPYPMTASHKAWLYRDFVAKRPVNIRNIQITTGAASALGNYQRNYEVVNVVGAYENPRAFIEEQPSLPSTIQLDHSSSTTNVRTILDVRRNSGSHFKFVDEYNAGYLTGTENKSVIVSRFAAPGGIEVMGRGYLDYRSSEYSVYNCLLNRNLTVLKPSQASTGSLSEPIGSGTAGIRVFDIHGKDYGLRSHLSRHSARFGRDSMFVTSANDLPGASYDQLPSFHKINRNRFIRIKISNDGDNFSPKTVTTISESKYDNFYVQHPIPRSDRQYSWLSKSTTGSGIRFFGFANSNIPEYFSSSADGYVSYFDFVSASSVVPEITQSLWQPVNRLNILTYDPITASDNNTLGFPATIPNDEYINKTLVAKAQIENFLTTSANYFNLLMTKRGGTYGWNWKRLRIQDHPILRNEQRSGTLSRALIEDDSITVYNLPPVSMRGRPMLINYDNQDGDNVTLKMTNNNEKIYFNDTDLNNRLSLPNTEFATAFEQVVGTVNATPTYHLNWVLYSQNIFPSIKNEFLSSSRERIDYDNKFWRGGTDERVELGNSIANSFGATSPAVSQSCWPLDAQADFLSRSSAPTVASGDDHGLIKIGSAGELQNNYFSYHRGAAIGSPLAPQVMKPAALYSRKHLISSPRSVVAPTGPFIAETGSIEKGLMPFNRGIQIDIYGGEALWEAGDQAGIVTISNASPSFEASASSPWFDTYQGFKTDIKKIAPDFSIIPEFRISNHIKDYIKYGTNSKNKSDTFEIPGTIFNSSTSSFYIDYSNSEFIHDFLKIKKDALLGAKEIRLVCSAAISFNPYKGFYPAQRTIDIVSQFSSSYGAGFEASIKASSTFKYSGQDLVQNHGGLLRPLLQPLFAPGILFNSIKAGMAVEYPAITDPTKLSASYYGADDGKDSNNWAITPQVPPSSTAAGYRGGEFWDVKIPFEAILAPEKYIAGVNFLDVEPHPSASLNATASMGTAGDEIYSMMASNFFGEVAAFFLKDNNFTKLSSETVTSDLRFSSGSAYGARIKLKRSVSGSRDYRGDSGSLGNNTAYSIQGGAVYDGSNFGIAAYSLPQDPKQGKLFKESFTMYSRPSAFGPAVAGQPDGTGSVGAVVTKTSPMDSFYGFNWSFTPPYANGEAWVDMIFRPSHTKSYDLEQILTEMEQVYWRADPGPSTGSFDYLGANPLLISSFGSASFTNADNYIYSGHNVNANAMQISASLNLLGVERVLQQEEDSFGNKIKGTNITAGKRWVIQPKWESPMLNFNDKGVHPITNAAGNLTLPTFASGSVPRGMWHQFGVIPDSPDKGVFMEIGNIPPDWLKNHYDVIINDTVYNDNDADTGGLIYKKMKSLTDIVGFSKSSTSKRLGEIAESRTIKEAVVAIPYIIEDVENISRMASKFTSTRKKFISIPRKRFNAALKASKGTKAGDSLDAAGTSIRKLIEKMPNYILPPQFDFLSDTTVEPIVMYMFEFEYKFDKDDLSYIWQNIAPRNSKKIELQYQSISHELISTELLQETCLSNNENLRWMVFKVKQRAQTNYYDLITPQAGESSKDIFSFDDETAGYKLGFNWPYDYLSFVEMIKMDVDVLYHNPSILEKTTGSAGKKTRRTPIMSRPSSRRGGGSGGGGGY